MANFVRIGAKHPSLYIAWVLIWRKMLAKWVLNNDRKAHRILEILPGFVSWNLILFPIWASFFVPHYVAYFVILFDVFWFYKSGNTAVTSLIAHFKIRAASKVDWLTMAKKHSDFNKVQHIALIPTYKEPITTLKNTLDKLAAQDLPSKKFMTIVMAFEERELEAKEKSKILTREYKNKFANFLSTYHPDIAGEVKGKSSNQAYAGKWIKNKLINELGYNMDFVTITSVDADSQFHPKYYSYLTFEFLNHKDRYRRFWHAAIWYYANIWKVPSPIRVVNTFGSVWRTGILVRRDLLVPTSVYSVSLKMIDEVGYWDVDVIPEDYRIFFKCFFAFGGKVHVEPMFIPIYVDAAQSSTYWKTLVNQYEQMKRWAWGVSDDPNFIKWWITKKEIPFWDKTVHLINIVLDHFLWPVNWFIITLGTNLPVILNPVFARTVLGQNLPKISFIILNACLVFLLIILWVDWRQRPKREKDVPLIAKLIQPLEFILMPVVGFFFSALPGIDAHSRLMFGKYLEYKVTEKV